MLVLCLSGAERRYRMWPFVLAVPRMEVEIMENLGASTGSCEPDPPLQGRHHLSNSNGRIFDISIVWCELDFFFFFFFFFIRVWRYDGCNANCNSFFRDTHTDATRYAWVITRMASIECVYLFTVRAASYAPINRFCAWTVFVSDNGLNIADFRAACKCTSVTSV